MKKRLYLLVVFCICCFIACKKTSTTPYPSDTFFKVYSLPLAKGQGTSTTANSVFSITSDAGGNIYTVYTDSLPASAATYSIANRIAILKTDNYGKMIWKKSYFVFYSYSQNSYYYNFTCSGQTLYLLGQDTSSNWVILTFNCADGALTGQIPLNSLLPAGSKAGSLYISGMVPTKEGNFMINSWFDPSVNTSGNQKPMLTMLSPAGNIIWSKSDFPLSLSDSNDWENGKCVTELANGDFIYSTLEYTNPPITTATYGFIFYTLNFYRLSSSGNLLSKDSLPGGANIYYANSSFFGRFYNCDGEILAYSVFASPMGGYTIVCDENYEFAQYRLKIYATDTAFQALDSAYISPANCNIIYSGIIQKADGSIVVSVVNVPTPLTTELSYIYEIAPSLSIKNMGQVGLTSQSLFINAMSAANDGHILMNGVIQTNGIDTNNVFILKMDDNGKY